jgi:hypothetical protein
MGIALGFAAAKSWSRKRYSAARTTPRARTRTSDEELTAIVEEKTKK